MKNQATVDVFLGTALVDKNEQQFLQRLRRDLLHRGVSARILANVQAGRDYRQVDFIVATEHRAVMCELKSLADPIRGGANGHWVKIVGDSVISLGTNPIRQAHDCGYAVSDTMRRAAQCGALPGPEKPKFVMHLDLVVCVVPTLAPGSQIEKHPHVTVLEYDALLDRLQRSGPRPPWSGDDWDRFIRFLGLYRDTDDAESTTVRRASAAAVDEYCARYRSSRSLEPNPIVPVSVEIDGTRRPRPQIAADLANGRHRILVGPPGYGKTLWAAQTAVSLAEDGHVPIWLSAGLFSGDFAIFLARAVASFTTHPAKDLIAAAASAGRGVLLIVDGLNECASAQRPVLLGGARAIALRAPNASVLITTQPDIEVDLGLPIESIELNAPAGPERRDILNAYEGRHIEEPLLPFVSPLELALAARCADDLDELENEAQLYDRYVDLVTERETTRALIRETAWRMHIELRLSVAAADVVRAGRRDLELSAEDVDLALGCSLIRVHQGRISFAHERFGDFLSAEALLMHCPDARSAALELNEPRHAGTRRDVIALEADAGRVGQMLALLEDAEVLTAAALGDLGQAAAAVARATLTDALRVASATTTSRQVRFLPGPTGFVDDSWAVPSKLAAKDVAQLVAAGRCLSHGLFVDEISLLLEQTDALCEASAGSNGSEEIARERIFNATYPHGRVVDEQNLPAMIVADSVGRERFRRSASAGAAAQALVDRSPDLYLGTIYVAMMLIARPARTDASLVRRLVEAALKSGVGQLCMEGLQLLETATRTEVLDGHALEGISDVVGAVNTDNIFLSSVVVEAQAALGEIEPASNANALARSIRLVLAAPDDPLAQKQARGFVASQFEDESIVGPYFEIVQGLAGADRELLFTMALQASDLDDLYTAWVLGEVKDMSSVYLRSAIVDLMTRSDPEQWHSPQFGIANALVVLRLLARENIPMPSVGSSTGSNAWRSTLDLVDAEFRAAAGQPLPAKEYAERERDFFQDHRPFVADTLSAFRSARGVASDADIDPNRTLIRSHAEQVAKTLTWSLEHPNELQSLRRWSRADERTQHAIEILGEIGGSAAADVIRRFANDPAHAEVAARAVRTIEARGEHARSYFPRK